MTASHKVFALHFTALSAAQFSCSASIFSLATFIARNYCGDDRWIRKQRSRCTATFPVTYEAVLNRKWKQKREKENLHEQFGNFLSLRNCLCTGKKFKKPHKFKYSARYLCCQFMYKVCKAIRKIFCRPRAGATRRRFDFAVLLRPSNGKLRSSGKLGIVCQ